MNSRAGTAADLDSWPVSRQIQLVFVDWLLLALTYLWAVFLVSLGVYALTMRGHSSRPAAIIIKVLGVLVLLWGLWELFHHGHAGSRLRPRLDSGPPAGKLTGHGQA